MKKLLLGLGSIIITTPIALTVACGETKNKNYNIDKKIIFKERDIKQGGWFLTTSGERIHSPEHNLHIISYEKHNLKVEKVIVDNNYIYYDIMPSNNYFASRLCYGEPTNIVPKIINRNTGETETLSLQKYVEIYGDAWRYNYADKITTNKDNYNDNNPIFNVKNNLDFDTKIWINDKHYIEIKELINNFEFYKKEIKDE